MPGFFSQIIRIEQMDHHFLAGRLEETRAVRILEPLGFLRKTL